MMEFQRLTKMGGLTVEQLEGAIITIEDNIISSKRQLEIYKTALKNRRRFKE